MKRYLSFLSFILLLFVSSCKDDNTEYSEQDIVTKAGLGNVSATLSATRIVENRAYTDYELNCPITGTYYLSTWMEIPLINGDLPEYQIKIDDVLSESTFKPSQAGFQGLILTDSNNEPAPITLTKGMNKITLVSVGREILNVEEMKVSADIHNTKIDDAEYQSYVKQLIENPSSGTISTRAATTTQSDQIYDYVLNLPATHTYTQTIYLETDMKVRVKTTSNNFPHVIELYNKYYKFTATGTSSATLDVIMPDWWGDYTLRIRALEPGTSGLVSFNYYEEYYGIPWERNYVNVVAGGNTVPVNRSLSNYYILSHSSIGLLSNTLSLIDAQNNLLQVGGYKRVYPNAESVSGAADPYVYYEHEAYLSHSGRVNKCHVTSWYLRYPSSVVDVYMGLGPCPSRIHTIFPNAPKNNTFLSGHATGFYNCISWSVERTDYWEWPGNLGSSYYNRDLLAGFDKLYNAYGYTRSGATAENAGIALWGTSTTNLTHASVRKNANTRKPHGFAWESKCGGYERIMHERDALNGSNYGSIRYYYRPINSTRSAVASENIVESVNLSSVSTLSSTLKKKISLIVTSEFESKYSAWKKTWDNPEIAIHSNPRKYAESKEYAELLKLCRTFDKASWPMCVEKLTDGDILVINLIQDLTISDNMSLMEEVKSAAIKTRSTNTPLLSMYSNYINYCTKLLSENKADIQTAISKIN